MTLSYFSYVFALSKLNYNKDELFDYETNYFILHGYANALIISLNDAGDEVVANPKGSCCKGVGNPGVDVIPVDVAVALGKGHQVEVFDVVGAQQDWKKFIEDNVLPLSV